IPGHADDQLSDRVHGPWPAGPSPPTVNPFPGNQSPMPCQNRVRRDERPDLTKQPATKFFSLGSQPPPLIIGEAQPLLSELFFQDSVLGLEVVDDRELVFVDIAGKGNEEQAPGVDRRRTSHGGQG
ncbi:MAG: hypothetical protein JSV80_06960, partial [Acidobacteriota bacterium]